MSKQESKQVNKNTEIITNNNINEILRNNISTIENKIISIIENKIISIIQNINLQTGNLQTEYNYLFAFYTKLYNGIIFKKESVNLKIPDNEIIISISDYNYKVIYYASRIDNKEESITNKLIKIINDLGFTWSIFSKYNIEEPKNYDKHTGITTDKIKNKETFYIKINII